jgi:hypothetical protein
VEQAGGQTTLEVIGDGCMYGVCCACAVCKHATIQVCYAMLYIALPIM